MAGALDIPSSFRKHAKMARLHVRERCKMGGNGDGQMRLWQGRGEVHIDGSLLMEVESLGFD